MGHWSMHIEGHGIHDNHLPGDADAQLKEFTRQLEASGHQVHSAHFATDAKELVVAGEERHWAQRDHSHAPVAHATPDDNRPL